MQKNVVSAEDSVWIKPRRIPRSVTQHELSFLQGKMLNVVCVSHYQLLSRQKAIQFRVHFF